MLSVLSICKVQCRILLNCTPNYYCESKVPIKYIKDLGTQISFMCDATERNLVFWITLNYGASTYIKFYP